MSSRPCKTFRAKDLRGLGSDKVQVRRTDRRCCGRAAREGNQGWKHRCSVWVGLAAVQCGEIGWKEALWFLVLKRSACDLVRCDVCSPLQAITVVSLKLQSFCV